MTKASEVLDNLKPVGEAKNKKAVADEINKIKVDIQKMEKSLDKYLNMSNISDKDRKDMRKILADIKQKEDDMTKLFDEFMKL